VSSDTDGATAWVRQWGWSTAQCTTSGATADVVQMLRSLCERLTDTLCSTACMDKVE